LALGAVLVSACAAQSLTATPATPPASPSAPSVLGTAASPAAPVVAASPVIASAHTKSPARPAATPKVAKSTPNGMTSSRAATQGAPPVSPGGTTYGFAAPELLDWSTGEQVQQLEAMKATGVTSVRVDASWYNTQLNGAGTYNWTPIDNVMSSIRQAGLTADLIIDGCPPWAAAAGATGIFAQPASPAQFAGWAAAVAKRYSGQGAKYFEIWNEPNNPAFWSPKPDPAAYTADLKAAYPAIKAVAPSAVVLTGGLAPEANSANSYDIVTFFQDMYADGAQGSFDGVGDHPYTYPYTPATQTLGSAWSEMSQTSPSLRSLMAAHGDSAKKIWITEFGSPTDSGGVTDAQQGDELAQAIAFVNKTSWIGSFYIYSWEDGSDDGFGVLASNGAQKPAYSALVSALR
jgi:polysaccharide biosynthesis protein PslG